MAEKNEELEVKEPEAAVAIEVSPEGDVPADNAPAEKKPRELFYERIRTNFPDDNFDENEDAYYEKAQELMDSLEKGGKAAKDFQEKIVNRFNEDPEEASAFLAYLDGMPLVDAIVKFVGEDALTMREGDEGWDSFSKAREERKEKYRKQKDFMDEIERNTNESSSALADFAKENGLSEEQVNELMEAINNDLEPLTRMKFSKDIYGRYWKALKHDEDVEGARKQGEADGRNEKIEAEHKRMKGSGLPNASAGGSASEDVAETGNATADWLGRFQHK